MTPERIAPGRTLEPETSTMNKTLRQIDFQAHCAIVAAYGACVIFGLVAFWGV